MARIPDANWRPLPENEKQGKITPIQIILHTAVDGKSTTSLWNYFNSPGINLETHGYFQKNGGLEQYMDTLVRADANYKANGWAISFEAWDGMAGTKNYPPYTAEQVETIISTLDFLCRVHNIPRRIAPAFNAPGIGWHNLYPEWSYPGATGCPGNPRIQQIRNIIIPRLASGSPPPQPTTPQIQETDMFKLKNVDGRGEIIALAKDGRVMSSWQSAVGGPYGVWGELRPGKAGASLHAEVAADGRLCVTIADPFFGLLWGTWQSAPGQGPWTDWFLVNDMIKFLSGK
jgi:hypothetical protein